MKSLFEMTEEERMAMMEANPPVTTGVHYAAAYFDWSWKGDEIMKVYLVGGAVRDHLMGKPSHDRDFVVVGATPEEMLAMGYEHVGERAVKLNQ